MEGIYEMGLFSGLLIVCADEGGKQEAHFQRRSYRGRRVDYKTT